jgi:hypothetical protein
MSEAAATNDLRGPYAERPGKRPRATWKYIAALFPALLLLLFVWVAVLLPKPCTQPITYRLGTIDPRFNLSDAAARQQLDRAAAIWNRVEGKPLLAYDSASDLPVNFIYGDVQQSRDTNQPLAEKVEHNQSVVDSLEHQISNLQRTYQEEREAFEADNTAYNRTLDAHNARVEYLNENGGGAAADHYLLEQEEDRLKQERAELETRLQRLNGFSDRINALINRHNSLVFEDNRHVAFINRGAGVLHLDGLYHVENGARSIDIFEVADDASLVTLLAHELGHALGLGHNFNPNSVMAASGDDPGYGTKISTGPKSPSAEDIASLDEVCRQ